MYTYTVTVVPGDGIGPEVCEATIRVLERSLAAGPKLKFNAFEAGAECYRRTGDAFPEATLDACRSAHAVLHGAAGLPDVLYPDGTEAGQDFSMKIRSSLDLYANLRPIRLYRGVPPRLVGLKAGQIDYVIVRENTEGLYAARGGGNLLRDDVASDTLILTRTGIERIVRMAADVARRRRGAPADGVRRVTIVDKSNVLRSYAFFRRVADEVLAGYPDISVDHMIVDAMTVRMIERPDTLDVVVTENLFGDILSDLGAATIGGMGVAAAAEVGERHGYFQASHGSAPSIAGQGIANPLATILSGAEMLDWLGARHDDAPLIEAAERVRKAVETVLSDARTLTRDLGGSSNTMQCADAVCAVL